MCLRVSYFVYLGLGLYLYLYWAINVELDLNFTVRRPLSRRTYGNRPSLGPWHSLDQFIVRFVSVNVFPCCSCICIFLSMHISLSQDLEAFTLAYLNIYGFQLLFHMFWFFLPLNKRVDDTHLNCKWFRITLKYVIKASRPDVWLSIRRLSDKYNGQWHLPGKVWIFTNFAVNTCEKVKSDFLNRNKKKIAMFHFLVHPDRV